MEKLNEAPEPTEEQLRDAAAEAQAGVRILRERELRLATGGGDSNPTWI